MPRVEEETYEMYRLAAEDAGPALAELRKGLAHEFGAPPERDALGPTPLDAYGRFRELARALSGMARYHELAGRYAEATDCLLDGMEVAAIVDHGGGLIAFLNGRAIEAISIRPLARIVPGLSAPELAHLAERLERIEGKATPFADVLREEGYMSAATWQVGLRQFDRAGPRDRWDTIRLYGGWPPRNARAVRVLLAIPLADRPSLIREQLRYYEACAEAARRPFAGSLRQEAATLDGVFGVADTLDRAYAHDASRRACRAVLRTEVALLRYRAERGRFPDALNALAPEFLSAVPDDPCGGAAGRPLRYSATENGAEFTLYSMGPDLKDDGGTPMPKGPGGQESGDIVAGKLWPKNAPRPVKGAPVL
jgi:hypothetical protein